MAGDALVHGQPHKPERCFLACLQSRCRLHVDGKDITLLRPDELRPGEARGTPGCQAPVDKV